MSFKLGDEVRVVKLINRSPCSGSNATLNLIGNVIDIGQYISVGFKAPINDWFNYEKDELELVPTEKKGEVPTMNKFKAGDKVKIVSINPFADYEAQKVFMGSDRESYYTSMIGKTSTIKDTKFAPLYILDEKDKTGPLCLFDSNLELVKEGETEMLAKFKIGDEVRVTATYDELKKIGAIRAWAEVGKVHAINDICFDCLFRNGDVIALNYAQAELVTPEKREIKLLSVGDKVLINGQECTVYEVNDEGSDYIYHLKSPLGMKFALPNDLAPIGSCYVAPKFEVGEIVLDKKTERIGKIIRDDGDGNRYKVKFKPDETDFRRGVALTKLPQEVFQDLFKE